GLRRRRGPDRPNHRDREEAKARTTVSTPPSRWSRSAPSRAPIRRTVL
ncbi:MAG: hypothetical protein AVDCRST_MAG28-3160, partial [uncultured Rubrobacteraceae bacterium]